MSIKILPGFTTSFGNKAASIAEIGGSAAYVGGTGQKITKQSFGMRSIEFVGSAISVSGNYLVTAQPSALGDPASWILRWFAITAGVPTEPGAGPTDLSAETVQLLIIGG